MKRKVIIDWKKMAESEIKRLQNEILDRCVEMSAKEFEEKYRRLTQLRDRLRNYGTR